jgi:PAS domain S-box-containing protein
VTEVRGVESDDAGALDAELDELDLLRLALAREAARYRTLFESAPVGFITTDLVGKVLEANVAAGEYFQLENRFLVGKPILTFVAPEERRAFRSWMLSLRRHGARGSSTARMRRRSGVAFEAYVRATPSDDQIWWAIVDVTAQQQAEENVWTLQREIDSRVATQLGEIHAVYEELHVGIAIVDAATRRLRGMNRRAHEILRYWDGELPGLERFTVDGEPVPSERWQVNRALEGEVVPKEVNHVRTPQGADIILEVSAAPLRDEDGTVVAAAVTFDDLSERERRELADAQFVENAAHQLRTPITAIAIAAAALEAGAKDDPEERERFVAHIARESDRMARLVEALLGLARLQRGAARPTVALVPLAPLLAEIATETEVQPGAEIVVDCPGEIAVIGDGPMLREAIANVVRNAAAHTASGTIRITAALDDEHAIVDVADSGPGIAPEARERVFERFFRAGPGTRGGAGLGLAIAAEAVRANGGTLELADSSQGAAFRFTVPGAKLL